MQVGERQLISKHILEKKPTMVSSSQVVGERRVVSWGAKWLTVRGSHHVSGLVVTVKSFELVQTCDIYLSWRAF